MEFEIDDQGQDALFDDSIDPGLRNERHPHRRLMPTYRHADPDEKLQKAELIPEEEHQLA